MEKSIHSYFLYIWGQADKFCLHFSRKWKDTFMKYKEISYIIDLRSAELFPTEYQTLQNISANVALVFEIRPYFVSEAMSFL